MIAAWVIHNIINTIWNKDWSNIIWYVAGMIAISWVYSLV